MSDEDLDLGARGRVGTVLGGKYTIDGVLGVGGMAVVYAATHRNQRRVAIKMLHPDLSRRPEIRERFLREGYAANVVDHPGAVAVLDDDTAEDGAAYLVMERLEGDEVERLWERRGRRLDAQVVMAIADGLLAVLEAAHARSILHRDIKPANLYVTRDGTLKVLDFGIARVRDLATGSSATKTGAMMGTPAFMSPEQASSKSSEIDGRSDLWSVGATMFALLSGRCVHEADTIPAMLVLLVTQPAPPLASVLPSVDPRLGALVDRALAFDRAARWPDAASLRAALRAVYLEMFGARIGREPLEALFADVGSAATVAVPSVQMPLAPPASTMGGEPPKPPERKAPASLRSAGPSMPSRVTPPPVSASLAPSTLPSLLGMTAPSVRVAPPPVSASLAPSTPAPAHAMTAPAIPFAAPAPQVAPLPPAYGPPLAPIGYAQAPAPPAARARSSAPLAVAALTLAAIVIVGGVAALALRSSAPRAEASPAPSAEAPRQGGDAKLAETAQPASALPASAAPSVSAPATESAVAASAAPPATTAPPASTVPVGDGAPARTPAAPPPRRGPAAESPAPSPAPAPPPTYSPPAYTPPPAVCKAQCIETARACKSTCKATYGHYHDRHACQVSCEAVERDCRSRAPC